jgi:hypothetical protein
MVDTVRTLTALQTLLGDNLTGAISPQDLRDMLVSLTPAYGSMYISTPAATTVVVPGTYVKAAGGTTAVNLSDRFDMPANNRLRYLGTTEVHAHVAITIAMTVAGNNQDLAFHVTKNGTEITGSHISHKLGTGADEETTALHIDCHLAQNDYLELWLTNTTSTAAVTLNHMYFFAMTMLM